MSEDTLHTENIYYHSAITYQSIENNTGNSYVGQTFVNLDEVYSFYGNYVEALRFDIKKSSSGHPPLTEALRGVLVDMEFTDAYKQAGPCCFSPDARFLAVAVDYRLVVRDVVSLKVVQLYTCVDKISYIEWALDSEYILCGLYKRPIIQAWSLAQPEWTCKIDDGLAGITYARWSPDSRHILTISEFQLRLTVWSLLSTACVHIQGPKHASKCVSFTRDGKFAAVGTRHDCKDYINLLSCHTWEVMGTFAVDTVELAGIEWSPDDSSLVIWDSLLEYKVLVYSPDGRCLFKYQAYESGLGVKTVAWSPCGQFLAVGSYDQVLRTLSHLTWKNFAEFMHAPTIRSPCIAAVFKEVDEPLQLDMSELYLTNEFTRDMQGNGHRNSDQNAPEGQRFKYKVMDLPVTVPHQKPPPEKPNPKQGVGLLSWSSDSQYLFSRNDSMPNVLWVWDILHLELAAVLIQKEPIRAAAWDPTCSRIVMCTGSSHLYIWTPSGAYCVCVPLPNFTVTDLRWSSDGSRLLLKDRDNFCCAFVSSSISGTDEETSDGSEGNYDV